MAHKTKCEPIIVSVRYVLKHPRIKSNIKEHQEGLSQIIMAPVNTKPLLKRMDIGRNRWNKILAGAEPTLGEAVKYAEHYRIDLSQLYSVIPAKTTKQK